MDHFAVPDQVKKFLQYFQDMINEKNVYEVNNLYENSFPKLTETFFKTSPWPEADEVAPYVNDDPIFLNLYRELYYRHIYARVQVPTRVATLILQIYLGRDL